MIVFFLLMQIFQTLKRWCIFNFKVAQKPNVEDQMFALVSIDMNRNFN